MFLALDFMFTTQQLLDRIQKQISSWERMAPEDEFAGMKLTEFCSVASELTGAVEDQKRVLSLLSAAIAKRKRAEKKVLDASKRLMLGMKCHPKHGLTSPILAASGFKTERTRSVRKGTAKKESGDIVAAGNPKMPSKKILGRPVADELPLGD